MTSDSVHGNAAFAGTRTLGVSQDGAAANAAADAMYAMGFQHLELVDSSPIEGRLFSLSFCIFFFCYSVLASFPGNIAIRDMFC